MVGFSLETHRRSHLIQRSPTFLAPGTGFMEDGFFHRQAGEGDGFGMTQLNIFIGYFISIIITLWSIMKKLQGHHSVELVGTLKLFSCSLMGLSGVDGKQ